MAPLISICRSATGVEFVGQTDDSYSVSYDRSDVYHDLDEAFAEASEHNWDGYDSERASLGAYIEARRFIGMLPTGIPTPEIAVSPQGRILFCWQQLPIQMLTLTMSDTGDIAFASLKNGETRTGKVLFADFIPEEVRIELFRLHP